MNQLLAEIVANELAEQQCHIRGTLLDHDRCLLIIAHDVRMALLLVNRLMYFAHFKVNTHKFLLCLDFKELFHHEWPFLLRLKEVCFMPRRLCFVCLSQENYGG